MKETIEGTLHVTRVFRSRGMTFGALLADYVQPRYYKQPHAYVTAGEMVRKRHEVVVGLRGKVLDNLTIEDDGKPVKVTGDMTWNQNFEKADTPYRIGTLRRVKVEFLASAESQSTPRRGEDA